MFSNRTTAGRQLADELERYLSGKRNFDRSKLLVVGLPRGGVPIALEVALRFSCPIDIIAAKKLPLPGQPEYAIGAVSSDGVVVLNPEVAKSEHLKKYIASEREQLLRHTKESESRLYQSAGYAPSSFKDKTVIIVDDGIATGMTALAAAETAQRRGAKSIILAAPVMSLESYKQLRTHCNEVIALDIPRSFVAVGHHYEDFEQTSDDEVVRALRESMRCTLSSPVSI